MSLCICGCVFVHGSSSHMGVCACTNVHVHACARMCALRGIGRKHCMQQGACRKVGQRHQPIEQSEVTGAASMTHIHLHQMHISMIVQAGATESHLDTVAGDANVRLWHSKMKFTLEANWMRSPFGSVKSLWHERACIVVRSGIQAIICRAQASSIGRCNCICFLVMPSHSAWWSMEC